ncbi:jg19108 [Pararge aegeria aegeria]|uniref:Jg19108 protein n=1 Tax=Pararge aegeria aegeria TaxID=348720 RepID=A0A8S4S442_9NEOP|nr:jg19108 [Pararge aegeria aegeria]
MVKRLRHREVSSHRSSPCRTAVHLFCFFGRTLADNHLRGCYGVTGGVGRARKLAMRRAPGLDDIESASCEDSDLGSVRR